LLAVQNVLQSFAHLLKGQTVQVNVDNQNACRIISVGSSKEHLHSIALKIFEISIKHDLIVEPNWIPRDQNFLADYYSKFNDTDDWSIDNNSFRIIENRFGTFTIDRFSSDTNKKVSRFNSKFYCPGTSNVNAFTADWGSENNWLCPPVSLIGNVLKHMKLCNAVSAVLEISLFLASFVSKWFTYCQFCTGFFCHKAFFLNLL